MSKYLVITIRGGEVEWISKTATEKGAEMSKLHSLKLWGEGTTVRVLSVEEILKWDDHGVQELEALMKL